MSTLVGQGLKTFTGLSLPDLLHALAFAGVTIAAGFVLLVLVAGVFVWIGE